MSTIQNWIESSRCEYVAGSYNGQGRGDGYDVRIFRDVKTSRYIIEAQQVSSGRCSYYTASTLDGAQAVGADGYTPGGAPGKYTYVAAPDRLAEVRVLTCSL
jgi:hypothetical protein